MPNQTPTILVKKTDGTSVRMTLDEFKVYKKQGKEKTVQPLPVVAQEHQLSTSTPVRKIVGRKQIKTKTSLVKKETQSKPRRKVIARRTLQVRKPIMSAEQQTAAPKTNVTPSKNMVQWSGDDHRSPLEDTDIGASTKDHASVMGQGKKGVDAIIKEISFSVPDDLRARLVSLIESRLRDVRTDDQLVEYAMRPSTEGGLGLSQAQADELLGVLQKKESSKAHIGAPLKHDNTSTSGVTDSVEQMGTSLVSDGVVPKMGTSMPAQKVPMEDIRPAVVAQEYRSLGPVEEVGTLDLVEFRRWSQDPQTAAHVLEGKFDSARAESVMEYLRMVHAWRQSPLFLVYAESIGNALKQGKQLEQVVGGDPKQGMTFSEIIAIASVHTAMTE